VNKYVIRRVQEEDLGVLVELAQLAFDPSQSSAARRRIARR